MKFVEAIQLALHDAMQQDSEVLLLGEDIAVDGGVFRATDGLYEEFGLERVIDTPLAEASIAGVAVGLAAAGMKPVAEIQFMGFAYPCIDQLANHASRLRNRTRGRLTCPMVLRIPYGGGIHAPEHHSESVEAMFAHIPGLRVVVASNPARAYGLLRSAIDNPDPVVFLEPKRLYQMSVPDAELELQPIPLDQAQICKQGEDVSILSWGAMMPVVEKACDALSEDGVSVELIDISSLSLLDEHTIATSVEKTGRCVIVHEAVRSAGFGAEISARLAESCILSLRGPIKRVTGFDTVMPLSQLEESYMPSSQSVVDAARQVLSYS